MIHCLWCYQQPPSAHRPKTAQPHPSVSKRTSERLSVTPTQSLSPKQITPIQMSYPSKPSSTSIQASRSVRAKHHHTAALLIPDKASKKTAHLTPAMSIKLCESDRVMDFRASISEPSSPHGESREQVRICESQILFNQIFIENKMRLRFCL